MPGAITAHEGFAYPQTSREMYPRPSGDVANIEPEREPMTKAERDEALQNATLAAMLSIANPKAENGNARKHLNSTMLGGCLVLLIGNLGYSIYWGGQKQAEVSAAATNITRLEQRIDYMQAQYESTGRQIAELKGLMQGMQPRQPQR